MATTPVQEMRAALDCLEQAVARVASLAPRELGAIGLVEGLERLLTVETQIRSAQSDWLDVAESSDATVEETGRSVRSWLIEEQHLGPAEASRRLRISRGLSMRPALRQALRSATVSPEHVATILQALAPVPVEHRDAVEAALLEIARDGSPVELARAVDQVRESVGGGETAEERADRRYGERGVELDETFGGTGSLSGTLTSECRETLRVALTAAMGLPTSDDTRSVRQRRHDALAEIAGFFIAHADSTAPETGERPRVVVTMSYADLTARLDSAGLVPDGVFDSGAPLDAASVRRLACDAQIVPALLGSPSEPLDLGRASRSFSSATRRAAKLRDGGRCARHGCTRRIVDCHHIRWWSNGGDSDLGNAAWLCAFHHWLIHNRGWTMRRLAPGRYVFTDPAGQDHGPPPQAAPAHPPRAA